MQNDLKDLLRIYIIFQEPIRIAGKSNPHNALSLPEKAGSVRLEGCHHVELFAKTLNKASDLKNITISGSGKVVLHPRMFEIGSGTPPKFDSFDITNVRFNPNKHLLITQLLYLHVLRLYQFANKMFFLMF